MHTVQCIFEYFELERKLNYIEFFSPCLLNSKWNKWLNCILSSPTEVPPPPSSRYCGFPSPKYFILNGILSKGIFLFFHISKSFEFCQFHFFFRGMNLRVTWLMKHFFDYPKHWVLELGQVIFFKRLYILQFEPIKT